MHSGVPASDLRGTVEAWFVDQGVPHFRHGYSTRSRLPALLLLLFTVVAFQVGVAPWLDLSVTQLLLMPVVLATILVVVWPSESSDRDAPWWSAALRFVAFAAAVYLLVSSDLPGPWSNPWVDFGIVFAALATSSVLFAAEAVWVVEERELVRQRRFLVTTLVLAVVCFALEGSLVGSVRGPLHQAADAVVPAANPVPQGLPALVVAVVMLTMSVRLAVATHARMPDAHLAPTSTSALIPAVPLLVLVFGGETAVLPHAAGDGMLQALPLFLAVTVALGATMWGRLQTPPPSVIRDAGAERLGHAVQGRKRLWVWVGLYLLSYPLLALAFFDIDAFGERLDGLEALGVALGINAIYLGLVWAGLSFGLDRVAIWAWRRLFAHATDAAVAIAGGLPLLLVFAAFFVLQAELWEVVVRIDTKDYIGLLLLLLGLTVIFITITSGKELGRLSKFESWQEIEDCTNLAKEPSLTRDARTQLVEAGRNELHAEPADRPPNLHLRWSQKMNALAILGVYQALIFIPLTIASAAVFWLIGKLAVPNQVAANWVYGDRSREELGRELANQPFFDQPWTRVAIILGAVSLLYLAVHIITDPDERERFLKGAENGLRERLAIRLAYREAYFPEGEPEDGRWKRRRERLRQGLRPEPL